MNNTTDQENCARSSQVPFSEYKYRALLSPSIGKRTKLQCLYDAALYLVTNGSGSLPLSVLRGWQNLEGPSHKLLMELRRLLETITLSDFLLDGHGLEKAVLPQLLSEKSIITNESDGNKNNNNTSTAASIMVWNIVKTQTLSIVIFGLPKNTQFELHTHPGMIVLTKILHGSVNVTAGSLLGPFQQQHTLEKHTHYPKVLPSLGIPEDLCKSFSNVPLECNIFDFGAVNCSSEKSTMSDKAQIRRIESVNNTERSTDCDNKYKALWKRMVSATRCPIVKNQLYEFMELTDGSLSASPPRLNNYNGQPTTSLYVNPDEGWTTTAICTPIIGNIHKIVATSDFSLILDVVSPPYDVPSTRNCDHFINANIRYNKNHYLIKSVSPRIQGRFNFVELARPPPYIDLREHITNSDSSAFDDIRQCM